MGVINRIERYTNKKTINENNSQINFKRKKTKSNIRRGIKIVAFSFLAAIVGIFFSNLTINLKIEKDLKQLKESKINEETFISDYPKIIDKVSPSIVTISDSKDKFPGNFFIEENTTGVIINEDGIIITNYSKIKDMESIYVKVVGSINEVLEAEIVGENQEIDLAFIKVNTTGKLQPIKLAKEERVKEGQKIVLLSNSIGDEYIGGVYEGIISSNNRIKKGKSGNIYKLLQINGDINTENTSGAICNSKGELLGVASLKLSNEFNQQGVYYAVDMTQLNQILSSATKFKNKLGIDGGMVESKKTASIQGFYVDRVIENGNAHKAGIKATDIIYEIDGKKIIVVEDISEAIKDKKNGDTIKCKVIRNGISEEINVIVK